MEIINNFHIGELVFVPVIVDKKQENHMVPYVLPQVHVLEGVIDNIEVWQPVEESEPCLLYRVHGKVDTFKEVCCLEWQMFRTAGEVYTYMTELFNRATKEFDFEGVHIH